MSGLQKSAKGVGIIKAPIGGTDDVLFFDNTFDGSSSPLLTIAEIAELLKVSRTSVRRLQQQRKIPFIKVGASIRFLKQDFISYVGKQRVKTIE